MTFSYDLTLNFLLSPLQVINQNYQVLNISTNFKKSLLQEKPVLLLAAGPSLQKNIEWIKQHQQKFIIVAVSATLKKLYAEGIVPDIVTHIDGFDTSMVHYEGIPIDTFLQETLFLFTFNIPKPLREMLPKERIFFFETVTHYFENFGSLTTPCVGSMTLGIMLMLGVRRLYLLGLDMAFDQESGKTHTDGHVRMDTFTQDHALLSDTMNIRTTTVPVQGNFRDHVFTSSLLNSSIESIYRNMPLWKNEQQSVFNLSDGAKLYKTLPTRAEEVNMQQMEVLEKQRLHSELLSLFQQHSSCHLSKADTESMQKRLDHLHQMHRHITAFQNAPHANTDSFLNDIKILSSRLIESKGGEADNASYLYFSYLQYTLPLIFDIFNTQELINPKKHIKKIDSLFLSGLSAITQQYESALEKFLERK